MIIMKNFLLFYKKNLQLYKKKFFDHTIITKRFLFAKYKNGKSRAKFIIK